MTSDGNRYRVIAKLGSGGMAEVFLGVQVGERALERLVVIKRVHSRPGESDSFPGMFLDEAKIVASLNHPHIIQIYDLNQHERDIRIVMEYIDGESLSYILKTCRKKREPIPMPIICRLMEQACEGLHYAHTATSALGEPLNIVHRDIDPKNLMMDTNGYLKIIDFGVAKAALQTELTGPGLFKGKLSHVAPDAFTCQEVDSRADIYSLGLVLFELATLTKPFVFGEVKTVVAAIQRIVEEKLADPCQINPSIPRTMGEIIAKASEKDRDDRYQTAAEFGNAIREFAAENGGIATSAETKAWLEDKFGERLEKRREFENKALTRAGEKIEEDKAAGREDGDDEEEAVMGQVASVDLDAQENGGSQVFSKEESSGAESTSGAEHSSSVDSAVDPNATAVAPTTPDSTDSTQGGDSKVRIDGEASVVHQTAPGFEDTGDERSVVVPLRKRRSSRVAVIAGGITAALLVAAAVIVILLMGRGSDKDDVKIYSAAVPIDDTAEEEKKVASPSTDQPADIPSDQEDTDTGETQPTDEEPVEVAQADTGSKKKAKWGWKKKAKGTGSAKDEAETAPEEKAPEQQPGVFFPAPASPAAAPAPAPAAAPATVTPRATSPADRWYSKTGTWSGPKVLSSGCSKCHRKVDPMQKTSSQWKYFFSRKRHNRYAKLNIYFSPAELARVQAHLSKKSEKDDKKGIAGIK